jgi:hypothetical protein
MERERERWVEGGFCFCFGSWPFAGVARWSRALRDFAVSLRRSPQRFYSSFIEVVHGLSVTNPCFSAES